MRVSLFITVCGAVGQGRFAQHVVGKTVTAQRSRPAAPYCLVYVATQNELIRHDFHGGLQRCAQNRLFHPAQQLTQQFRQHRRILLPMVEQLAGQHQAPGGRVDKQRTVFAQVLLPVRRTQLVRDQGVHRAGIRYPQQRLGQAHQHHAFVGGQVVMVEKCVQSG